MGVGKTVQAIAISYLYRKDWPVLVIVPSSLKHQWRDEILRWLDFLPAQQVQIVNSLKDKLENCMYTIVSYSLASKMHHLISRMKFQIVIADEAHYLKSMHSKRALKLVPLLKKFKRVLLLTGTPLLGRPQELYNLLKILRPDLLTRFVDFGCRYAKPRRSQYGIDWSGTSMATELHLLLSKSLMIRRLKSEVLSELPTKRRQQVRIPIDSHRIKAIQ
jgi:SWI/SNF-related matrix-associated actin-dependent regulator 1 of chromatin subfamily A